MQVLALIFIVVVLLVFVGLLSKSKSSGFVNPDWDMQNSMRPAYVGQVGKTQYQINRQTPINTNSTPGNWQSPRPAEMLIRRLIGLGIFVGIFLFFNPMGETSFVGIVTAIIVGLPIAILLNPGNVFIVPYKQYIKWYRLFSRKGEARQVMAFEGEAGWQPGKKLQGWRYKNVWWNDVAYFSFTEVPSDAVWYIRSRIGKTLQPGRKTAKVMPSLAIYELPAEFIADGGELNIQRSFLTPGFIGPIDLVAFQVDDGNLAHSNSDKSYYKPFRIPDDKFGMVTCKDSECQVPEGAIFARLGGFYDIEKEITEKFGKEELDPTKFAGQKGTEPENDKLDSEDKILTYDDIFRFKVEAERKVAGRSLKYLLEGPQEKVEDYQNIVEFDMLNGTVGMHWRLIRPGRLLNINHFVFDIKLVTPLVVKPGTVEVMILSTGAINRDVTQKGFRGGRLVRVGGNGINLKALEPAQYPLPGEFTVDEVDHSLKHGRLLDLVEIPTRQLSLFFGADTYNEWDGELESITERSKDGILVTYDFNVILTIPAESAAVIVAAFGSARTFIKEVVAAVLYGVTVEFIRNNTINDITDKQKDVLDEIKGVLTKTVQGIYGVKIHQVRMEHFEAKDYLTVLERKAKADADLKALDSETSAAEKRKELRTKEGEAEANFIKAKAEGLAEEIKRTYGAKVEQFGKEGATLIQALQDLTSGKHPIVPEVLGMSGDGGNGNSLMPLITFLSGVINKKDKNEEVKTTTSPEKETKEVKKEETKAEEKKSE